MVRSGTQVARAPVPCNHDDPASCRIFGDIEDELTASGVDHDVLRDLGYGRRECFGRPGRCATSIASRTPRSASPRARSESSSNATSSKPSCSPLAIPEALRDQLQDELDAETSATNAGLAAQDGRVARDLGFAVGRTVHGEHENTQPPTLAPAIGAIVVVPHLAGYHFAPHLA
jgi:hypothetical protein